MMYILLFIIIYISQQMVVAAPLKMNYRSVQTYENYE